MKPGIISKRIAALAATAIVTLTAGITVALTSHSATATTRPQKPAAVAVHYVNDVQAAKKTEQAEELTATPLSYTVHGHDYLSSIAAKLSGSAGNWPALWYANKSTISNPDAIKIGQMLFVPPSWDVPAWMLKQALAAIPGHWSAPAQGISASAPDAIPTGSLAAYALKLLGGNQTQFSCLNSIVMVESSWNVYAQNPYSGAYGIPQALPGSKMGAAGSDWASDGYTQLRWMIQMYIPGTYGTACNAWAHEQAYGSY